MHAWVPLSVLFDVCLKDVFILPLLLERRYVDLLIVPTL